MVEHQRLLLPGDLYGEAIVRLQPRARGDGERLQVSISPSRLKSQRLVSAFEILRGPGQSLGPRATSLHVWSRECLDVVEVELGIGRADGSGRRRCQQREGQQRGQRNAADSRWISFRHVGAKEQRTYVEHGWRTNRTEFERIVSTDAQREIQAWDRFRSPALCGLRPFPAAPSSTTRQTSLT